MCALLFTVEQEAGEKEGFKGFYAVFSVLKFFFADSWCEDVEDAFRRFWNACGWFFCLCVECFKEVNCFSSVFGFSWSDFDEEGGVYNS